MGWLVFGQSFYLPPKVTLYTAAADVRESISNLQGPPSVQGQSMTKATGAGARQCTLGGAEGSQFTLGGTPAVRLAMPGGLPDRLRSSV